LGTFTYDTHALPELCRNRRGAKVSSLWLLLPETGNEIEITKGML
jgi:hypothetical protein